MYIINTSNLNMNNIEFRKILQTIWCKIKDLTHIHNNLEGLQGGQEEQYYHLTEEQYNCVIENCTNDNGSSNPLIEVTYDQLVNLKNNSKLKKGQNYLLTDYETTYKQPVTSVNKSSGVIEPLIITATDVNKLHNVCKSTLYPQDIVYYEVTGDLGTLS